MNIIMTSDDLARGGGEMVLLVVITRALNEMYGHWVKSKYRFILTYLTYCVFSLIVYGMRSPGFFVSHISMATICLAYDLTHKVPVNKLKHGPPKV